MIHAVFKVYRSRHPSFNNPSPPVLDSAPPPGPIPLILSKTSRLIPKTSLAISTPWTPTFPVGLPPNPGPQTWRFKMLYDGHCPLCRREIKWLQRINRHGALAFEDISAPDFNPAPYNKQREDLMAVIHGVLPDGTLVTKMDVFRHAYTAVGLRWLIAPTRWPLLKQMFDLAYAAFARWRIPLGKLFGRGCDDVCHRKP